MQTQQTKPHALKLESLTLSRTEADDITQILGDFLEHGLGFRPERIEELECRSRDGFMAYSHNKGGVEAIGFMDQVSAEYELPGSFENAHKTLERYRDMDLKHFKLTKGIPSSSELTQEQDDEFFDWRRDDSEATVLLSADLMLTGENSLNIRLCVCVKDAPYHRVYDDKIEIDLEFNSTLELIDGLNEVLSRQDVTDFASAASETY